MAKQDAVTIHPRDAEKDDTANGTCKDKQLKVPDLVDVAGLAIRDTPSNGRQHNSPDLGHCTSPQLQPQPQPSRQRQYPGSSPPQPSSSLREHPLNTTAKKLMSTSPAGALVDSLSNRPSLSDLSSALASDLASSTIDGILNNSQNTRVDTGIARWHTWVAQQARNETIDNAIQTDSQESVPEITPSTLIQYLEAVIIPLERESSLSVSDSTSVPVKGAKGTVSVVETYIKPVLKLWQHQYQLHQEQRQAQQQRQLCRNFDPSSSSSSVALSSESKSFHECLSGDRAVALNVQHTIRKQDQLQRLVHLEKSHRDTALVISQLQDQVQRLAENCAHQKKDQLQLRQEKDQKVLRASDESGPNEVVNLATLSGRQITHRAYSPLIHRYQHQHQQHPNGYYCSTRESHRADELIEAIAKGLEEYHARTFYERTRQRSGTETSAGHHHPTWHPEHSSSENPQGLSHQPHSPYDSAVDYHQYDQETLDRSRDSHQRQSTSYFEEQSPSQPHRHHHTVQHQRHQKQQTHAGFQQDDLLEIPSHHPLHDQPIRSRKRSSSMSGPGGTHKENIKQARSCSPPRPRTTSDPAMTEGEGSDTTATATTTIATSIRHGHHTLSQSPSGSAEESVHESRMDTHLRSPKNNIATESSASTSAATSLAMLHYGSVERARQNSVSSQHTNHYPHRHSTHPHPAADQGPQAEDETVQEHYPPRPSQSVPFSYTPVQPARIAPPSYSENDYRSYPEPQRPSMRHHSHPSQSYSHLDEMAVESLNEPSGYRPHEADTQVPPYFHTPGSASSIAEPQLPVFRGKHSKNQGPFGYTGRNGPIQQRLPSLPAFSQQQPLSTSTGKPHPYQCDESRIYSSYEQQQRQQSQLSRHHDPMDEDIKSPNSQEKEYQHHYHTKQYQQQQQQQPQQILYRQPQQHQFHSYHHDADHQQPLQSASTSSPPPSSSSMSNQHHHHNPSPPIYVMNRQVNTVPELWKEWTIGLGPGCPSIRQLEAQYGPSWRTSSSAANFFSRRLRIIHEIQRMVDYEGLTEEEAVNRLEARREQGVVVPGSEGQTTSETGSGSGGGGAGMSLHRLSEILRKKQL